MEGEYAGQMWFTWGMFGVMLIVWWVELAQSWRAKRPHEEEPRPKDTIRRIKQP